MAILIIQQQKHLLNNSKVKYFDIIFNECEKLNKLLEIWFVHNDLFFLSASLSEILYGLDGNTIVFCYYPEKYEYGKMMFLKGVLIRLSFDKERQYSIDELNSFF